MQEPFFTIISDQPICGEIYKSRVIGNLQDVQWKELILVSEVYACGVAQSLNMSRDEVILKPMLIKKDNVFNASIEFISINKRTLSQNEKDTLDKTTELISHELVHKNDSSESDLFFHKNSLNKSTNEMLINTLSKLSNRKIKYPLTVASDDEKFKLMGRYARKHYEQPVHTNDQIVISRITVLNVDKRILELSEINRNIKLNFTPKDRATLCDFLRHDEFYKFRIESATGAKEKITRIVHILDKDPVTAPDTKQILLF